MTFVKKQNRNILILHSMEALIKEEVKYMILKTM